MLNEDLDIFTDGEFGTSALVNGLEVSGIFDESYEQSFDLGYSSSAIPSEGRKFTFKVQSAKVKNLSHGDAVEFLETSRVFKVTGVQPIYDGLFTNLILKEVT